MEGNCPEITIPAVLHFTHCLQHPCLRQLRGMGVPPPPPRFQHGCFPALLLHPWATMSPTASSPPSEGQRPPPWLLLPPPPQFVEATGLETEHRGEGELGENPGANCDFCVWREREPARGTGGHVYPVGRGSGVVPARFRPRSARRGLLEGVVSTLTFLFSFPAPRPGCRGVSHHRSIARSLPAKQPEPPLRQPSPPAPRPGAGRSLPPAPALTPRTASPAPPPPWSLARWRTSITPSLPSLLSAPAPSGLTAPGSKQGPGAG